jgi:hypothetical protein
VFDAQAGRRRHRLAAQRIIVGFAGAKIVMEAERLNALTALLADLTAREQDLRGYL